MIQKLKRPINVALMISFLLMILLNILANALPLAGVTSADVSDQYPTLITPAGFIFIIWSVIYAGLLAFVILQVLRDPKHQDKRVLTLMSTNFVLNALWIVLWHYQKLFAALIVIFLMLVTLTLSFLLLRSREWYLRLPVEIYLGWISVATAANFSVYLVSQKWGGLGLPDRFWTILILTVLTLINILAVLKDRSYAFGLVGIWALYGMFMNHQKVLNGKYPMISALLVVFAVLIALSILYKLFFKTAKGVYDDRKA